MTLDTMTHAEPASQEGERRSAGRAESRHRLQKLLGQLRESESRFRIMADCAPVLLWMAEPDALCTFFNKTWLDFTGRDLDAETGNGWAEGVHPEDFQRCMDIYMNAFVARRAFRMEYRLRRADGEYRWILDQGLPRHAPGGTFAGYIGSCIDITELKESQHALERMNEELEQRVLQRTAELQQSNDELQQFAYVTSHDLQAPLRAIVSYIELLKNRYSGKLDADADDFIGFVADGGKRMQTMINDLLAYSRTGRGEITPEVVESGVALNSALDNLKFELEDSGAEVRHAQLPAVRCDMTQLILLFQNLVANAVKFHSAEVPRVEIGAEQQGAEWLFRIRDNGIGIAPAQFQRVFQIFQRLHTAEQYPGSGMGLAICKKILERHQGRIWVQSEPGKGSTFFFTLPCAPAESSPVAGDANAAPG